MGKHPAEDKPQGPNLLQRTTSTKPAISIERFFNKIKHYRRIATRYDKLAENYLAALKLVAVRDLAQRFMSRR